MLFQGLCLKRITKYGEILRKNKDRKNTFFVLHFATSTLIFFVVACSFHVKSYDYGLGSLGNVIFADGLVHGSGPDLDLCSDFCPDSCSGLGSDDGFVLYPGSGFDYETCSDSCGYGFEIYAWKSIFVLLVEDLGCWKTLYLLRSEKKWILLMVIWLKWVKFWATLYKI